MNSTGSSSVEVRMPEPLLGRPRFGPFPSVADALKFLLALALGAVVAAFAGPLYWLPFVGGGFLLAVYRSDGKSVDERCGDYLRWRLRPRGGRSNGAIGPTRGIQRCAGGFAAGLRVGGVPLAFLPVAEQEARFRSYRALLDSLSAPLWMEMDSVAVLAGPYLPRDPPGRPTEPAEIAARSSYAEFASLLVRRRRRRLVRILLLEPGTGAIPLARLSTRLEALRSALERLEIPVERLHGTELARLVGAPGGAAG